MVPCSIANICVRDETWRKIALEITKMLSSGQEIKGERFKKIRHKRQYLFSVRRDLIEKGIIEKKDRHYRLNVCDKFYCRNEVLDFISLIREGGDNAANGAEYLRKMSRRPFEVTRTDVLKFMEKEPCVELRQVSHITDVQELWVLLDDILEGRLKLETKIQEKMLGVMQVLLEHIKFHGHEQLLKLRTEEFQEKVKAFTFNTKPNELTSIGIENAIKIFREMHVSEEFQLDFVEGLIERKADALKRILNPLTTLLFSLGEERVRRRIMKWAKSPKESLQYAAKLLLESKIGI